MNAVEIESAISDLALEPFDAAEFPFVFLAAFGNKETALKRLRAGNNNASDVPGGVLLRSNIHIASCESGSVGETLKSLRASPATTKAKAKFILATDGQILEAEELITGETITCDYQDLPNHFGFLLPLAGISTIKEIKDNPIDVRATSRLNKLYVELLNENPDWAKAERRADMNHFMARLVFCFFAEDTDIFNGDGLFTKTVEQFSERDGSNTDQVLSEIFRAMNVKREDRASAQSRLPSWADKFPYVNGGLFSGSTEAPRFTRMARTYLLHAGKLNWQKINPDIFGSMIQAVADDEERGALGMHYTSVPNILKVLNPLFLDGLRAQLEAAGDNKAKLLNLRKRMARIRVFDPACGSGNFLVIAYKQMREIEAEINRCRGEANNKSEIPLTNFRGIELRDFPAEIARLALIIAEFQCDVLYRGQQDALAEFLPLNAQNWIVCGNALRLDWLSICPPTGTGVKVLADDLFGTPLNQTEIDFVNEGGETYICGNPPYLGSKRQTEEQKSDLEAVFGHLTPNWRSLDYVAGWFLKASDFRSQASSSAGFVATNSICQGQQASILWPLVFGVGYEINFAHTSFNWRNLASHNAGVTVVIVGIALCKTGVKKLYHSDAQENSVLREVPTINAYLIPGSNIIIEATRKQIAGLPEFERGNSPTDGGHLLLDRADLKEMGLNESQAKQFIRPFIGSLELIRGASRFCIWIEDEDVDNAMSINSVADRVAKVRSFRLLSTKLATRKAANWAYRFDERKPLPSVPSICVPVTSSENRAYLPADLLPAEVAISNLAFGMPCAEIWVLSIVVSRMMLSWVSAVCARMRTDYRFTNTLCWNTFPAPLLTEQNKADLTRSAEDILLAREAHFPATIADLYDPESMPDNLRHAHERNDEVLERIYIGRRFRNDTERLEKLFDLYTKMTADTAKATPKKPRGKMA
ncbi:class I SAM-dependent DNA methyltransferase [Pseudomonas veronii]|uniref:class I SAM-dependent DNA methyltransferase n=1 Tax=Pseudomonas veronii TaxID=76761 RepID=UPI000704EFD1|nr:DNA methyltransferase [Pseudomonas veronii]SEB32689.1 Type II restriction/modification system, DNA methylase subunit YeeA [Pseudomonas marginalis]KRP67184.1 lactate dehydrogenase [Pseudomonas veronii]MBJ2178242.1 class I SAM-dependent DNA methyltransferase [Pseudomonas veronii]OPK03117.1 lactate dehydrogenase [Pseudomonas veronii]CAD0262236.1 putative type II restriction enzyme, methylase subunit [Pseudomonas veronii]